MGGSAEAVGPEERSLMATGPCSTAGGPSSATGTTLCCAMATSAGGVHDE